MLESDETLCERVKRGDMGAFDALYVRYEGCLFGFLLSQLKNRADAEEVFHEAFLAALRSPPPRLDGGAFRAWLFRVARNKALNRLRTAQRGARAVERLVDPGVAPAADEALATQELNQALDLAVQRLPPSLAEVFQLRSSGLSYEEIAQILEIPLGTLKSRMHQVVGCLREELKPWIAG